MKTLIILLYSMLCISLSANELKWVDEQIQAIKPSRTGVTIAKVNATQNPFIFLKKIDKTKSNNTISLDTSSKKNALPSYTTKNILKKQSSIFTLKAIINNSALIDGKWYKLNEKVGKYTLSLINGKNIILSYKNKKLYLSTVNKIKNLKFKSH